MLVSLEFWFNSLPVITKVFVAIIGAMTFLMVAIFYNNRTLTYGPTALTMIGIFGCFLGISLGLMDFNTGDIQGSVPALVDGIKTAFWASVAGVGGALLLKLRLLLLGPPRVSANGAIAEATVDDLAFLLRDMNRSIAGGEDSTLLSQTKLLRQENRDGLSALKASLDSYMEKVAESNSKALIEALKEVIRDFNTKINEQFGENFKQLNAAVENILIWQERYRHQIAEMIEQQTVTAQNMTTATERYSSLIDKSETFTTSATSLASLIAALEVQRNQIKDSIATLGNLLKTAGDNLPKIEERIVSINQQLEAGVRTSNETITSAIRAMTEQLNASQSDMTRLLTEAAESANNDIRLRTQQLGEQLTSSMTAMTENLRISHNEMKKLLIESAETTHSDINSHIKQLSENTQKQVVALDTALSEELTKSIQTLGEHLTALSRRFVQDYTPLTESLRALIQTAGRGLQ